MIMDFYVFSSSLFPYPGLIWQQIFLSTCFIELFQNIQINFIETKSLFCTDEVTAICNISLNLVIITTGTIDINALRINTPDACWSWDLPVERRVGLLLEQLARLGAQTAVDVCQNGLRAPRVFVNRPGAGQVDLD